MKSASRLSLSVIVFAGACVATFSGWTAETPTDRLPDTSKPGTAQRPGKVDKDSTKNQGAPVISAIKKYQSDRED